MTQEGGTPKDADANEQILKCHDDHVPVYFSTNSRESPEKQSFTLKEHSTCSWVKQGESFDSDKLRSRIEPWLTALVQSEHLSVLVGSGLTHAIHRMASDENLLGGCPRIMVFRDRAKS